MGATFAVLQCQPGSSEWLPVMVPISCNYVGMRNRGAVLVWLSSDPSDPDSLDDLQPGAQSVISAPAPNGPRFTQGTIVIYLKADTGTGKVSFQFIL